MSGRRLSEDDRTALLALRAPMARKGPRRRCLVCGLLYSRDEMQPEFDDEGRRVGWTCDGCG